LRGCFDTGSANSWILSTEDRLTLAKGENLAFDPEESNTFFETDIAESIQFGSGSLEGYFGHDSFFIGKGDHEIHIIN
jgi:hypothetical protein